jgi:serine/threonine protein kinase
MAIDPAIDTYLRIIEGHRNIGARFTNLKRVDATGGDGNFSLVLVATDNETGREVAIKVFRPDRQSEGYRYQCFCREEKILRALVGTPNVLGWIAPRSEFVEHVTTSGGIPFTVTFPYFAVELASANVAKVIRDQAWNPEQKLVGFREMCKAVQRIRELRISHRDIKPSNFLVTAKREVKLSDFGAARDLGSIDPPILAAYGWPPGDRRYASPEMLALLHDENPLIALESDIFGLGATLFELWTGAILGVQIYTSRLIAELMQAMNAVRKSERVRIYLGFVQSLAAAHPLPAISVFGGDLPPCIRNMIEDLYKSMAALDYRQRLRDFERIFLRIDQCLLVLRNEEKVRRWRCQKELFRRNRDEKRARGIKRLGAVGRMGESQ